MIGYYVLSTSLFNICVQWKYSSESCRVVFGTCVMLIRLWCCIQHPVGVIVAFLDLNCEVSCTRDFHEYRYASKEKVFLPGVKFLVST